jgi:hypothetical protein
VVLLAREGANLVLGYWRDPERAQRLSGAIEQQFRRKTALVEGGLREGGLRRRHCEAVGSFGAGMSGAAILSGDPARAALRELDREALVASLESNYAGTVLLAAGRRFHRTSAMRKQGGDGARGSRFGSAIESPACERGRARSDGCGNGCREHAVGELRSIHRARRDVAVQTLLVDGGLTLPGAC